MWMGKGDWLLERRRRWLVWLDGVGERSRYQMGWELIWIGKRDWLLGNRRGMRRRVGRRKLIRCEVGWGLILKKRGERRRVRWF